MKLLLVLLALTTLSDRAACHSACYQCRVRCKQTSQQPEVCQETCLELKRQCCQACGAGPGPKKTCSCT